MPAATTPPSPNLYFESSSDKYWLHLPGDRYLRLKKSDAALHLRHAGIDGKRDKGEGGLSDLERAFFVAQMERAVDYAGPLAGHKAGPFRNPDGKLILVTASISPAPAGTLKPTPFLEKFLSELLGEEQMPFALWWLKVSHQSMEQRIFVPGQAVALAGPSTCGKSFFQVLVTELLGGRVEKCFDYLSGSTTFNKELAEAEHWCIEDETAASAISRRRDFGNKIKQATVNPLLRVHGKGLTGITLPTWRRVTLSLNDESENLMVLPPMDASLMDKFILFKCSPAQLSADRKENMERLRAELPAFVAMLKRMRIPKRFIDERKGVTHYHNAELMDALSDIAPETRLMALIDQILADEWRKNEGQSWEGSAEDLEQRLRSSNFSWAIDRLLQFSSACGTYLARLAQRYPRRFEARKHNGKTKWIVREP